MSLDDFRSHYWMKAELIAFARRLGLATHGYKPEIEKRIERRLLGRAHREPTPKRPAARRDSSRPLRRGTRVVNFKSDEATRAWFRSQIGPHFHFTWHVNQWRLAHPNATYGDLVDEWIAEDERRRRPDYEAPIARQGKWNRWVRAFFADPSNAGKSLRDAARAWNAAKRTRGDHRYRPR
jgi:SAP domain-containing protein/uncharacterized protein DUF6434